MTTQVKKNAHKGKKSFTFHVKDEEYEKVRSLVKDYQKEMTDSGLPGKVSISAIIMKYINDDFIKRGLEISNDSSNSELG